jgi:hypothetical protein
MNAQSPASNLGVPPINGPSAGHVRSEKAISPTSARAFAASACNIVCASNSNTCFCGVRNGEIYGYEAVANLHQTERVVSLNLPTRTVWLARKPHKVLFSRVWDASAQANLTNWKGKTTGLLLCMGCQTVPVDVHLSMMRRSRLEFGLGSVDSILIGYGIFCDEILSL